MAITYHDTKWLEIQNQAPGEEYLCSHPELMNDPVAIEGKEMDRYRCDLRDLGEVANNASEELNKIRWTSDDHSPERIPTTTNMSILALQAIATKLLKIADELQEHYGPIEHQ